ncbi:MAG: hypothetical protein IT317_03670 [Anaerolineales bacterium]|nr:hypothetical protein [Anaerolineales bacterium]
MPDRADRFTALEALGALPQSLVEADGAAYGLAPRDGAPRLLILGEASALAEFEGERSEHGPATLLVGPAGPANAAALRRRLPWLQPRPLGLRTSAGFGDRLGLATPGHVRAAQAAGGRLAPIFAQQSIREMTRTGRTPRQVMDDATWGVFQEGWRGGVGADADHLKTPADIEACAAAGFTFYTIDPGEHVDNRAEQLSLSELRAAAAALPEVVQPRHSGLLNRVFDLEGESLTLAEPALLRAAVKYGRAVAHVARMYQHLTQTLPAGQFELEVSVDETEQPTTHSDHLYLACELRRLGVQWVSLAPRYVGRFEKGVDYLSPAGGPGDLSAFEPDFARHAAIARQLGPYKLSLHSGSDKFSIYATAARLTQGLVHLKTAGTSYLEALRTVAALDPALFREVYAFAREHYAGDRASYHVSAEVERAPAPGDLSDRELPRLLDEFDAREILHVTFGSVLTERAASGERRFYPRLMRLLRAHAAAYAANLERHFGRHLQPFLPYARTTA